MKRFLLLILFALLSSFFSSRLQAQGNQSISNGSPTAPVNFPGTGCIYNWVNDNPAIGLPASGTGNIPAFTGVNIGTVPVTATITAVPAPTGFAYVPNSSSSNVSVINLATNEVVKTIPVNNSPIGVAISPDGSKAYITNQGSSNITVINTTTNAVIATIACKPEPTGIAVSPDGTRLYVANASASYNLSVISTTTNAVIANIPVGQDAYGVVISPDGSRVYVTNSEDNTVSVINTSTNAVITNIPVGQGSQSIITSPDGSRLYVLNAADNTITIINTLDNTVVTTIGTGVQPDGVALSADGSRLYVTNGRDNTVSVISTSTNATTTVIPVGEIPAGASLSADGYYLYVTNIGSQSVSVINTVTNLVIATVGVGLAPISYGNFIKAGVSCGGQAVKFTITVTPTSTVPPVVTASTAKGNITSCAGTPSDGPQIEQFTASGSNLSGDITATAPSGFEVSLIPGSNYSNKVTLTQVSGTVSNTVVYVRSSASATSGNISGNVVLSTPGLTNQIIAVKGVVNALPTVNPINPQNFANGKVTPPINFTGTANSYTWVNNNPGIGLPASGTGNIASFTAVNTGTTPVIATITATPVADGYAYIANASDNTVSIINTQTNTVTSTIPVGESPWGTAISPDRSKVYVTNQFSDNISVISTATNMVVGNIPVSSSPNGIIVSPDGSKLYVATQLSRSVAVISTVTNTILSRISVGVNPLCVALNSNGSILYVTNLNSGTVSVINTITGKVITTIPVGSNPNTVCVSADDSRVYVANSISSTISVINTASNSVIATIGVGFACGVVLSPDGSRLYVTNTGNGNISVINTADNTVTATFTAGINPSDPIMSTNPYGESISSDGSRLYVTDYGAKIVLVINTATNAIISTIPVGTNPGSIGNFLLAGTGCSGAPVTFNITVAPTIAAAIITTGTLSPLSTNYGTPSSATVFTVVGNNLTAGVLVTPPAGFEVSTDDINFSTTVTVAGTATPATVYIRLAKTTPVGSYAGNIVLSSAGVGDVTVATARSTVSPDVLIVTADNKSKTYGTDNPTLTVSYSGFVNNETAAQLMLQPLITTTAITTSPIGVYPISVSDAVAHNYTFVYVAGVLRVNPTELVVPNTFTPNGDGINDVWNIKYIENYPNCTVDIYNRYGEKLYSSIGYPIAWDGRYKGANLPMGTYYYIIDPKGGLKAVSGYVAIIR